MLGEFSETNVTTIDINKGRVERRVDVVAREKPLHIRLNGKAYVTIMCTPTNLENLAVGHLITQGILRSVNDIKEIDLMKDLCDIHLQPNVKIQEGISLKSRSSRIVTSTSTSPITQPRLKHKDDIQNSPFDVQVDASTIIQVTSDLDQRATTYKNTGGVHIAAIYTLKGQVVAFAEDVGRHNAVDKAIGLSLMVGKRDLSNSMLVLSGRLSGDMVSKAVNSGIPILISVAPALNTGIDLAESTGITLIGFTRGGRFNIYTHPYRVLLFGKALR